MPEIIDMVCYSGIEFSLSKSPFWEMAALPSPVLLPQSFGEVAETLYRVYSATKTRKHGLLASFFKRKLKPLFFLCIFHLNYCCKN